MDGETTAQTDTQSPDSTAVMLGGDTYSPRMRGLKPFDSERARLAVRARWEKASQVARQEVGHLAGWRRVVAARFSAAISQKGTAADASFVGRATGYLVEQRQVETVSADADSAELAELLSAFRAWKEQQEHQAQQLVTSGKEDYHK